MTWLLEPSEFNLQRHLHVPVVVDGAGNASDSRGADAGIGEAEGRRIEEVECIHPELDFYPFGDGGVFHQRGVEVDLAGSIENPAGCVAASVGWRRRESRGPLSPRLAKNAQRGCLAVGKQWGLLQNRSCGNVLSSCELSLNRVKQKSERHF